MIEKSQMKENCSCGACFIAGVWPPGAAATRPILPKWWHCGTEIAPPVAMAFPSWSAAQGHTSVALGLRNTHSRESTLGAENTPETVGDDAIERSATCSSAWVLLGLKGRPRLFDLYPKGALEMLVPLARGHIETFASLTMLWGNRRNKALKDSAFRLVCSVRCALGMAALQARRAGDWAAIAISSGTGSWPQTIPAHGQRSISLPLAGAATLTLTEAT